MATALDRVQVLLQPDEYAELAMLAKEDRRSMAAMAAVLITEAVKARIREGTFTPSADDPAYASAKSRQTARMLGKKAQSADEKELQKLLDEMGTTSARKVDPSLKAPTVAEALSLKEPKGDMEKVLEEAGVQVKVTTTKNSRTKKGATSSV